MVRRLKLWRSEGTAFHVGISKRSGPVYSVYAQEEIAKSLASPHAHTKADGLEARLLTRIRQFDENQYWAEQGALIVKTLEMAMDVGFVGAAHGRDSHIENGPHVTADYVPSGQTSRRIACDSSIVTIKEDENGEPLSIGRRSRTIPPPMRRALRVRDKGCRFPGCINTRFVDGHHIEHWADGGETSLDNLVTLCRDHHHLVHEGGFVCEKSSDGSVRFRDQRESPLELSPQMPGVAANDDVQQWMDREFFEANIDNESCTAKWQAGERMDWQAAVGSLFY